MRCKQIQSPGDHIGPAVTRASLQADLLAAHERAARLDARIHQLEKRLSRSARRTHLARIRTRCPRRHRHPPPAHQPARTAQPRPSAPTRRTRRRPRRSPRRQPRTHGPTQHANPAAMTRASLLAPHLLRRIASPASASELHKLREPRWRTGTDPWRTSPPSTSQVTAFRPAPKARPPVASPVPRRAPSSDAAVADPVAQVDSPASRCCVAEEATRRSARDGNRDWLRLLPSSGLTPSAAWCR